MAGRVTGPYKGFFINASATLNQDQTRYIGAVSLTENGVDEPRKLERLVELGDAGAFASDQAALESIEHQAREYVDALLTHATPPATNVGDYGG